MAKTIKEWRDEFSEDKEVEEHFIKPLNEVLLGLKLVEKDKDRKINTPYVKAEILIPIGHTIKDVFNSEWRLVLLGVKYKKGVK